MLLYWLWGKRTVLGFETRLAGMSPRFATATGMNVPGLVLKMMMLSGALGGIAGAPMRFATSIATSMNFRPDMVLSASRSPCWGAGMPGAS